MELPIHRTGKVRLQKDLDSLGEITLQRGNLIHQDEWRGRAGLRAGQISETRMSPSALFIHSRHGCVGVHVGRPQIWGRNPLPAERRPHQKPDLRGRHNLISQGDCPQPGQGPKSPHAIQLNLRRKNQLAQIGGHLGQQKRADLAMGNRGRPQMGPGR